MPTDTVIISLFPIYYYSWLQCWCQPGSWNWIMFKCNQFVRCFWINLSLVNVISESVLNQVVLLSFTLLTGLGAGLSNRRRVLCIISLSSSACPDPSQHMLSLNMWIHSRIRGRACNL